MSGRFKIIQEDNNTTDESEWPHRKFIAFVTERHEEFKEWSEDKSKEKFSEYMSDWLTHIIDCYVDDD